MPVERSATCIGMVNYTWVTQEVFLKTRRQILR